LRTLGSDRHPRIWAKKRAAKPAKQVRLESPSQESEQETIITWPKYKDDLPNVFNTPVDHDLDFISKMPPETLDHIASFLLLDHESQRPLQKDFSERPHALLSFAAMSRKLYHCAESASLKIL
jgi:hypothetical protein